MTNEERQESLDSEHLRLLRLAYLISGWINVSWALFPVTQIIFGIVVLAGGFPPDGDVDPEVRWMGLFFLIAGVAISAALGAMGALKLLTARRLRERRSRTLCMVVAGLTCLGFPYGTALGAATLIVLSRPSMSAQFADPR